MSAFRFRFICPFCRKDFTAGVLCGGSFTDRDHPAAVAPVLVEFDDDGVLLDGEEARLARVRARWLGHSDRVGDSR